MVITVKLSCLSFLQKKSIFLYRKRRRKVKHLPPFKGGSSFLERDDLTFKKFRWDADFFLPLYYYITFYQRKSNKTWWEKWCCKSLGKCLLIYIYRHILEQHVTDIFHSPKKISKLILSIFLYLISLKYYFSFQQKKISDDFFHFDVDYSGEKMNLKTIQPFFCQCYIKYHFSRNNKKSWSKG